MSATGLFGRGAKRSERARRRTLSYALLGVVAAVIIVAEGPMRAAGSAAGSSTGASAGSTAGAARASATPANPANDVTLVSCRFDPQTNRATVSGAVVSHPAARTTYSIGVRFTQASAVVGSATTSVVAAGVGRADAPWSASATITPADLTTPVGCAVGTVRVTTR